MKDRWINLSNLPKLEVGLHVVLVEIFAQDFGVAIDALPFLGFLPSPLLRRVTSGLIFVALVASTLVEHLAHNVTPIRVQMVSIYWVG